ncbi:MAG TPA: T9SS type A sorting domain-containing protein [Flavobacterium sp.]
MIPIQQPRPGLPMHHQIIYINYGNTAINSGTITYTADNNVTVTGTTPGTTMNPGGFTYQFNNLLPSELREIDVTLTVPPIPAVAIGDILTSTVSVTVPPGDLTIENNSDALSQTVTNSYDPNNISENHGPEILFSDFEADEYLRYTIRFENTGNADAINIDINDLLDTRLNPDSVRMISASHPYTLDKVGSNLTWTFANINLPPSVPNSDTGKGYVAFEVKANPGFAIGDIIPNTALIYFDTNPAIVTNTWTTEFVSSLAVNQQQLSGFIAFPNPARNLLNISSGSSEIIKSIVLKDITGKIIVRKQPLSADTAIDISGVSEGLYFAKITAGNKALIIKILKE